MVLHAMTRLLSLTLAFLIALPAPAQAAVRPEPIEGQTALRPSIEERVEADLASGLEEKRGDPEEAFLEGWQEWHWDADAFEALRGRVLGEIRKAKYAAKKSAPQRLSAYKQFVRNQAKQLPPGSPVKATEDVSEGVLAFNRRILQTIRRAFVEARFMLRDIPSWDSAYSMFHLAHSLFSLFTQTSVPGVGPRFDSDEQLTGFRYRPKGRIYPTTALFWPVAAAALWLIVEVAPEPAVAALLDPAAAVVLKKSAAIIAGATAVGTGAIYAALTWHRKRSRAPEDGHEWTHIFQTIGMERIRTSLQVPMTSKTFYNEFTRGDMERTVRPIGVAPPSVERLEWVAEELFEDARIILEDLAEQMQELKTSSGQEEEVLELTTVPIPRSTAEADAYANRLNRTRLIIGDALRILYEPSFPEQVAERYHLAAIRHLSDNAFLHFLDDTPIADPQAQFIFSLHQGVVADSPRWFLDIQYKDNNPDPWEYPIQGAVIERQGSRRQDGGVGLWLIRQIVTQLPGAAIIVEAQDVDDRRKRLSFAGAPSDPTPLEVRNPEGGTEILVRLPILPLKLAFEEAAEQTRDLLAGRFGQGLSRGMTTSAISQILQHSHLLRTVQIGSGDGAVLIQGEAAQETDGQAIARTLDALQERFGDDRFVIHIGRHPSEGLTAYVAPLQGARHSLASEEAVEITDLLRTSEPTVASIRFPGQAAHLDIPLGALTPELIRAGVDRVLQGSNGFIQVVPFEIGETDKLAIEVMPASGQEETGTRNEVGTRGTVSAYFDPPFYKNGTLEEASADPALEFTNLPATFWENARESAQRYVVLRGVRSIDTNGQAQFATTTAQRKTSRYPTSAAYSPEVVFSVAFDMQHPLLGVPEKAFYNGSQVYPAADQVKMYLHFKLRHGKLVPEASFLFRAAERFRDGVWSFPEVLKASSVALANVSTLTRPIRNKPNVSFRYRTKRYTIPVPKGEPAPKHVLIIGDPKKTDGEPPEIVHDMTTGREVWPTWGVIPMQVIVSSLQQYHNQHVASQFRRPYDPRYFNELLRQAQRSFLRSARGTHIVFELLQTAAQAVQAAQGNNPGYIEDLFSNSADQMQQGEPTRVNGGLEETPANRTAPVATAHREVLVNNVLRYVSFDWVVGDFERWLMDQGMLSFDAGPRYGTARIRLHYDRTDGAVEHHQDGRLLIFPDRAWADQFPEMEKLQRNRGGVHPDPGAFGQFVLAGYAQENRQRTILITEVQPGDGYRALKTEQRSHLDVWRSVAAQAVGRWGHERGYLVFGPRLDKTPTPMSEYERRKNYIEPFQNLLWEPVAARIVFKVGPSYTDHRYAYASSLQKGDLRGRLSRAKAALIQVGQEETREFELVEKTLEPFRLPELPDGFRVSEGTFPLDPSTAMFSTLIREHPELFQGRILDLGTGNGALTIQLARQGATVVGVDTLEGAIDDARHNLSLESPEVQGRVTFGVSDLYENLPQITGEDTPQFNAVIYNNPLNLEAALQNIPSEVALNAGEAGEEVVRAVSGLDQVLTTDGRSFFLGGLDRNLVNFFAWEHFDEAKPEGWRVHPTTYKTTMTRSLRHVLIFRVAPPGVPESAEVVADPGLLKIITLPERRFEFPAGQEEVVSWEVGVFQRQFPQLADQVPANATHFVGVPLNGAVTVYRPNTLANGLEELVAEQRERFGGLKIETAPFPPTAAQVQRPAVFVLDTLLELRLPYTPTPAVHHQLGQALPSLARLVAMALADRTDVAAAWVVGQVVEESGQEYFVLAVQL